MMIIYYLKVFVVWKWICSGVRCWDMLIERGIFFFMGLRLEFLEFFFKWGYFWIFWYIFLFYRGWNLFFFVEIEIFDRIKVNKI